MERTCWDTRAKDSKIRSGQKDTEASIPTFHKLTFCKGLYGENDGPSVQEKRGEKHVLRL